MEEEKQGCGPILYIVMPIVLVMIILVVLIGSIVTFVVSNSTSSTTGTITDIASGNDNLSILVTALEATGLTTTLNEEGPFTVFAPTNAAFTAALESLDMNIEDLLSNPDQLTNILLYHVVEGAVNAEAVLTMDGETVPTLLEGQTIAITIEDGAVVLNGNAHVVTADVEASNGVIHIIDAVLLPEN